MEKTVDKTAKAGRHILYDTPALPETETVKVYKIPCDENGNPIGAPWEKIRERMYDDLSQHYGVDLRAL
jgi:hypothetical protein